MKKIRAGSVRFDYLNKAFLFEAPEGIEAKPGQLVIVETEHGLDRGDLDSEIKEMEIEEEEPLKKILRVADENDLEQLKGMIPKEEKALDVCQEEVDKAGLKMKLINSRYSFDGTKVSFCYTADGRVDFRELVRTLASRLKARIELRQVGVRDEARLLGGLGICGRALCCATFLREFQPVSIRMAKDQGLPLNPMKISGSCGRLFCCLKYEHDHYCQALRNIPKAGDIVIYEGQEARIFSINVLKEFARVDLQDGNRKDIPFAELSNCPCKRHSDDGDDSDISEEEFLKSANKSDY